MKAVRLGRFGGPEVLEVVEIPRPVPADGRILVRVEAAGVNFFEALMRQDRYAVTPELPLMPGVEVAGAVEAAGRGAETALGTRVAIPLFAVGGSGGYAEYVAADAAAAVPIPDEVPSEVAVALLIQGLTALHAARRYPLAGKIVLVTAAAGGVGSLLIQLVQLMGAARVIATASTSRKLELARSLGADIAVNYTDVHWRDAVTDATDGHRVDIAYDFVGGTVASDCLKLLGPGGILVAGALGEWHFRAKTWRTWPHRTGPSMDLRFCRYLSPMPCAPTSFICSSSRQRGGLRSSSTEPILSTRLPKRIAGSKADRRSGKSSSHHEVRASAFCAINCSLNCDQGSPAPRGRARRVRSRPRRNAWRAESRSGGAPAHCAAERTAPATGSAGSARPTHRE